MPNKIIPLIIIVFIVLLIFGPSRLPKLGSSVSEALKGFKKSTTDDDTTDEAVENGTGKKGEMEEK